MRSQFSLFWNRRGSRFFTTAVILIAGTLGGCGSSDPPGPVDATPPAKQIPAGGGDEAIDPATEVEMIDEITPDPPATEPTGGMRLPENLDDAPAAAPAAEPMKLPEGFDAEASTHSAPTIQFADWSAIENQIGKPGRVTVVDFWSTSCGPCLREYPNLVQLKRRYGDQLRAIGVNLDFDGRRTRPPETYEPAVRDFTERQGATFVNFISRTPSDDILAQLDAPSMPVVLIYDDRGELISRFVDAGETLGFTYQSHVVPAVEELLGT